MQSFKLLKLNATEKALSHFGGQSLANQKSRYEAAFFMA
jgi:hypothetical protein